MRTVSTNNKLAQLILVASVACLSGCAMCANPFDCDYAAYGSRLPRADMARGRVGSILDGSSAGVVTTQPTYDSGNYVEGEVFGEGEVIYDSQPYESNSSEMYESPIAPEQQFQTLPAQDQIERVYETIEGEIGSN